MVCFGKGWQRGTSICMVAANAGFLIAYIVLVSLCLLLDLLIVQILHALLDPDHNGIPTSLMVRRHTDWPNILVHNLLCKSRCPSKHLCLGFIRFSVIYSEGALSSQVHFSFQCLYELLHSAGDLC